MGFKVYIRAIEGVFRAQSLDKLRRAIEEVFRAEGSPSGYTGEYLGFRFISGLYTEFWGFSVYVCKGFLVSI